jgi:SAM-dependent methyltransferase
MTLETRSPNMFAMSTDEHRDHHGNPKDLQEYIARLDDPGRDEWQRPDVALAALGITKENVVCEIGTGTGYFALRLAKLAAWVYAIDVEPQLLSLLSDRAASASVQNLTPVLGLPLDPRIPPATCDLILTVKHVSPCARESRVPTALADRSAAWRPSGDHRLPQARLARGAARGSQARPRGVPRSNPRRGTAGG